MTKTHKPYLHLLNWCADDHMSGRTPVERSAQEIARVYHVDADTVLADILATLSDKETHHESNTPRSH